jgi:hypothetical protein
MVIELCIGGKRSGLNVRPDHEWPGMWRIHQGDHVSDMVNRTRAKDAAVVWGRRMGLHGVVTWHAAR